MHDESYKKTPHAWQGILSWTSSVKICHFICQNVIMYYYYTLMWNFNIYMSDKPYVIKFVEWLAADLWVFPGILMFHPPIKLTATIWLKCCWNGVKHYNYNSKYVNLLINSMLLLSIQPKLSLQYKIINSANIKKNKPISIVRITKYARLYKLSNGIMLMTPK
jgi:hypothetical protein